MNLLHFDESLEQFAHSTAILTDNGPSITYAELGVRVERVREKISGDKQLVCILCGLNTQSIVGYLATLRAGQTAMLINAELDADKIEYLKQQYQPEWIFEPVENHRSCEYVENGYGLRRARNSCAKPINSELALLLSTSGTTGSPKMVKLTKENLYANATSIVEYLSIGRDERAITSLPMHYSYGLSVINTHLAAGATIILTDQSMMTREFWDIFKKYEATSLAGVPYHYEMLLRLRFFDMDLPSLNTLTQAGGKLNPQYVQRFVHYAQEKNIRFFVMYGQTEATARISYIPAEKVSENVASIGVALPGGKLWLRNSNGEVIEEEEQEGELVYEGPNVMMGYATCRDDLAGGDELGGRLLTGDLATRDNDGFFTITGRMKRFLKIFGNRVNLDEVEQLLKSKGFDALCGGEDNSMLIVLTDASARSEAKKCVVTSLGIHHSGITTALVNKFFVTDSGKIDYRKTFASVTG